MYQPSEIELVSSPAKLADLDMSAYRKENFTKKEYYQKLGVLQEELLTIQQAYFHQGKRAIIVFEGWDASGKGGVIRRLTEKLDPRGFHVYPIGAPSREEQGRHYMYRFQTKLPRPGTMTIFDRSYYGRVLVERIERFATDQEWQRAYQEINEFERLLTDDGVRIVKLFLHISPEEQLNRFVKRLNNPNKRWKLTSEDLRNREKWEKYEEATDDMFKYTSTKASNWQLFNANDKKDARLYILRRIIEELGRDVDLTPPPLDHDLIEQAKTLLGIKRI